MVQRKLFDEEKAQTMWRRVFDPFGIAASCWEVQRAWMEHPYRLSEELTELGKGLWELQMQVWQRMSGTCQGDMCPVVTYDERFQDRIWTENPYLATLREGYLFYTRWLQDAIYDTPNTSDRTRRRAAFWVRQVLNATAPTNFFWTNPAAMVRYFETGGSSLIAGLNNLLADASRGVIRMVDEDCFEVGNNLATTPGSVVYRNELVELIQYAPTTEQVHGVPILCVAPWINKYYILDLNKQKSLLRYLVDQGFTVFVTSWKNPGSDMRGTTWEDYMFKGILQSIDVVREICGARQVHLAGYCIGGTLVAALMAWLNRQSAGDMDAPVAHWTLLATLVDFSNPGDIDVFIDEENIRFLENRMSRRGYLDGQDMAQSFRMLRSNSLIWQYYVRNYLFGESPPPFDVLYWNMDTTRLPETMHSFYLREFYLGNKLTQKDALTLGGRPIDLGRITQPVYVVGTEQDHITPWRETFKLSELVSGPVRYVLATSGHILGIISPPVDPPKRRYWVGDVTPPWNPESWCAETEKVPGSWWTNWTEWLRPQSGNLRTPPTLGNHRYPPRDVAPGTYVMER